MHDSPGKILKRERENRNIPLEKICAFTKIKQHHLKAIEEERYDLLPHPLYVKGYLKSYSQFLSLDEKTVLSLYENYLNSLLPPEPPPAPSEKNHSQKRKRFFLTSLLIMMFVLLGTVLAFYLFSSSGKVEITSSPFFSVTPAKALQIEEDLQFFDVKEPKQIEQILVKEESEPVAAIEILEAGLGTEIDKKDERHGLTGNTSTFYANHQRGYFFTRIKTPQRKRIAHVWLFEEKEYHRIEMEIKPPTWSVFSYLTFRPQHIGNWKAEVREGDQILTSLHFKVLQ